MHELALCAGISDVVEASSGGRRVVRVELQVGAFRQVVPATLAACWEMVTEHSSLAGSQLVIDHLPAVVACRDCGARTVLVAALLRCAACGSQRVTLVDGDELRVVAIEVEVDESEPAASPGG